MMHTILALAALAASTAAATSVSCTPHDSYSSSVGVLGCKINTNRVAYWPGAVDCTNICVKLTYGSRSVYLLRVDQSGGAHDISYDAWNYLQTGSSATADPISGGGVDMEYEDVDASACADLLHTPGNKLPLSASNSMGFLVECLADASSWVAQNHVLYNIADPLCARGFDEPCTLDLATSNQASCAHTLGLTTALTTAPVYNIEYPTGKCVDSTTGDEVAASVALAAAGSGGEASGSSGSSGSGADTETPTTAAAAAAAPATTSTTAPPTTSTTTTPPPPPTTTTAATTDLSVSPGIFVTTSAEAAAAPTTTTTPVQPTTLSTSTTTAAPTSTSSATTTSSSATLAPAPTTLSRVVVSSRASASTKTSASSSSTSITSSTHLLTAASSKATSTSSSSSTTASATAASKASATPTAASGAAALAKPASLCAVAGAWAVGWLLF